MFGFKKKQENPQSWATDNQEAFHQQHWPWLRNFLSEQLPNTSVQVSADFDESAVKSGLPAEREILLSADFGLQIWADFYQQHPQMLQLELHCRQKDFTDDLTELLVAVGRDIEEQRRELATQIKGLVLNPLLAALQERGGVWESLRLQGREHRFYTCESAVMGRCKDQTAFALQVPQTSLWQRFKPAIMPYLGCKNNYWLKLYQSSFGNERNCEVRINDRLSPELSELLQQEVEKIELTDWDQKQTVLLRQDAATCLDYPFKAWEVRQYALQALRMFAAGQDSDAVYQQLWAQSGDVSLACDLAHLLPEICCFKCVREADTPNKTFIMRSAAWQDDLQLRESQFGCYDWFEQAINDYFSIDRPVKETLSRIISYGATAKAMGEAMKKGSKTKNMRFSMVFWVPKDYILR